MPRSKAKAKSRSNGNGGRSGNGRSRRRNGNGGASVLQSIQPLMRTTANYRPMNNKVHQMSGSDFLSTVSVVPNITDPDDRILSVISVSPSLFAGTRLAVMSQLFERYRFVSFRVRYVPAVPTTLGCQLLSYLDTDPLDDPSVILDGDQLLRQATAHTGSQQWNFNTPKVISLPIRSDGQLYYTGLTKQNERFNVQAKIYLIQVTRPVDINGSPVASPIEAGSLYIDWNVRFETPQINPFSVTSPFARAVVISIGDSVFPVGSIITVTGLSPGTSYGVYPQFCCVNQGQTLGNYRFRPALISDGVDFNYATDSGIVIYCGHSPSLDITASNPKVGCGCYDQSNVNPDLNFTASDYIICPAVSDSLGRIKFVSVVTQTGIQSNSVKLFFVQGLASPVGAASNLSVSPLVTRVENLALANAMSDLRVTLDEGNVEEPVADDET